MLTHNDDLLLSMEGVLRGDQHPLSSLANAAALLFDALGDINWAGFYLLDRGALWLGPFQGKAACTRIDPGKGVCGAALAQNQTLLVPDVHAFPGHIACDEASRAEIVVPLRVDGRAVGVLDIDSPVQNRFSQDDRAVLERVAALIEARCDFTRCGYDLL